jgi:MYXO-CTERM domain-containing protein
MIQPCIFVAIVAVIVLVGTTTGQAGLIGTNYFVRYDGQVRSGANTGVEGHNATLPFATDNIPTHEIPVTSNPSAPLSAARVLTVTETEFLGPMMTNHVILDIQGKFSAGGPDAFVNNLDSNVALPIEFEGRFYSNDPTMQLVLDLAKVIDVGGGVTHDTVEIENFGNFYKLPPAQKQVSGSGTEADPLRIVLNIAASMVPLNNGRVKVHFYFGEREIPEPTTAALALVGLAAACGSIRRRSRG